MKKLIILFVAVFSMPILFAQDITDALRYSQSEIQGTARFRALSGAFGALGGDMSAVSINPAGSAVFSQSHASFSINNREITNDTEYFGGLGSVNKSYFDLNQGGASFVFKNNNSNSPWKKFTIGVAYDKTKDYDDEWFVRGNNDNDDGSFSNSIASYFYDYANNNSYPVELGTISLNGQTKNQAYGNIGNSYGNIHQQAFLGYQSFILDADTDLDSNTSYTSNVESGNFQHDYSYLATGYNGKITVNAAAQYGDNLYLGINLNSHFIDYERTSFLTENNSNPGSSIDFIEFENTDTTTGQGFSFQLGGILKVSNEFRIGLTYDSPTWYTIERETTQYLDTNALFDADEAQLGIETLNIFPQYKLQTPGKITGSLAYVFGKQGLISFDYSRKDYSKIETKSTALDIIDLNPDIKNLLTAASTYKIGGEYKYEQFSFRGGYRFEESPYTDGLIIGDLDGYSLGIGYNFGNTKLDITYDQSNQSFQTPLYNVGLIDYAGIDRKDSNVTISLSFNI